MTTKELAEFLGKPERTVQNWAKKSGAKLASIGAKLASVQKAGKPAVWEQEEACQIIEVGMGKNAADLYRMNARQNHAVQSASLPGSVLTPKDMEMIGVLVASVMANFDQRVKKIEARVESRQALLPAPQIKPRDHVSKIVREHAEATRTEYRDAWKELYREFGYRTNTNPSLCAKNRGMTVMDYLDAEGQIETLEAVALDLWGKS